MSSGCITNSTELGGTAAANDVVPNGRTINIDDATARTNVPTINNADAYSCTVGASPYCLFSTAYCSYSAG